MATSTQRAMNFHHSPKTASRGLFSTFSCLLFFLILLSGVAQPSSGQTSTPTQTLPLGVKVGDTFTYKILHNDSTARSYMLTELLSDQNIHPSDIQYNEFQIKISSFETNNSRFCYYFTNMTCLYFDPLIHLTYTSGTSSHTSSLIILGPYAGQLIVSNDWTFMKQNSNLYRQHMTGLVSDYNRTSTFQTKGSDTIISTHLGWYFNRSVADTRFMDANGYQELASIRNIYDTETGVMNYAQSNHSIFYPDGNIGNYSYELINKSYRTGKVKVPLANPIPYLILIAIVRKRRSSVQVT